MGNNKSIISRLFGEKKALALAPIGITNTATTEKNVDSGITAIEMDNDLRKLAGYIATKLPGWFTESQLMKVVGVDKRKDVIAQLYNIGLLKSGSKDGTWKHCIISDLEERIKILNDRRKQIADDIAAMKSSDDMLSMLIASIKQ